MSLSGRRALAASIAAATTVELPPDCTGAAAAAAGPNDDGPSLLDYEVDVADGEWSPWLRRVPQIEMERPQSVLDTDLARSSRNVIAERSREH